MKQRQYSDRAAPRERDLLSYLMASLEIEKKRKREAELLELRRLAEGQDADDAA